MALDIRQDDVLQLDVTLEQFVIITANHIPRDMFGSGWARRCNQACTVLRNPFVGGAFDSLVVAEAGLLCMQPYTVQVVLQVDSPMDAPRQTKVTYIKSPDNDEVVELNLGDVG